MPITVGRVENLFWRNNSYKKPNCAPTFAEAKELNQKPIIYSFMGGRTHLYGDQWNYAIYDGVYYFLEIDKCKDLGKKHYSYILLRDMWVNILLNHNVEVKGFLTTTNRDGWIEANLNRAHPLLTQPCNVTRLSLVEEEQMLGDAQFVESKTPLSLPLFDIRELQEFKDKWSVAARKYKKQVELEKYRAGNSPIFIFAELKGKTVDTIHCWKEYLRTRVNEFLRDLGNKDLVISKVQSTEGAGRLKEHYCITWNKGGIGSGVENVTLDLIDLGGLEDIVHINPKTLEEGTPMKVIDESVFQDIEFPYFQTQEKKFSGELITRKLRRKIYFPITQDPGRAGIALAPHYSEDNPVLPDRVNWQWLKPQKVKLKETGLRELFLFWIDNVDFALSYKPEITYRTEGGGVAGGYGGGVAAGSTTYLTSKSYKAYLDLVFGIREYPEDFKIPYPFSATWGYRYDQTFFKHQMITPLGFLIFKPFHHRDLDGYIWRGNATNKLQYISGLRRTVLEEIESGRIFQALGGTTQSHKTIDEYYSFRDGPTNENWNRYHSNLMNGLDILLQPNRLDYTYAWRAIRKGDRSSGNYSFRYLQELGALWHGGHAPFENEQWHRQSKEMSRRMVDRLVMKTLVELPVEIARGDYVFNDIEYWLDEHDTVLWTDAVSYSRVDSLSIPTDPILEKLFTLEDYVKSPGQISDDDNNSVVICSTREGNVEVRECIRFSKVHRLHSDIYSANLADTRTDIDGLEGFGGSREAKIATLSYSTNDLTEREQAVESVNGQTSTRVGYMVLKQMQRGTIERLDQPLPPESVKAIIAAFLKSNGYKLSPDNQSVLYFERKDFNEAIDLFFDLKGTDWYLHVKSGRISLIAKRPDLFRAKDFKVSKLKANDELKALGVVQKVNQKCVLNVYTHQRLLNTRFNFDNDKLNVSVKAIKPTHKMNPTNYYQMNLRGDFDVIEREILTIQKKQLEETATIVDYTQLESLRAQMRRNDRDYDISMAKDVMFATEKENEQYRRKKWDLDADRMRFWLNQGSNLVSLGLTGLGLPGLPGVVGQAFGAIGNLAGSARSMKVSATALGAVRGARSVAQTIGNTIIEGQVLEERGRRIEKDREYAFKEIAFRSLQIDLRHRDKQEDSIRQLNQMGNVYSRGTINDIDVIEEFNKENNLGAINLTVFTPSQEQLKVLEELKEEYGVDCDIPNAHIQLREGMSEDVIRFRHLEDEGLTGLDNYVERGWLMAALEMGIKVVDSCSAMRKRERLEKEIWSCANIYQLTKEIENQRILSGSSGKEARELRDEIAKLRVEINTKEQEIASKQALIAQLNVKAANDKSDIEEKAKKIAQKESDLATLRQECEKDKKELKDAEAKLKEEIRKHKVDFEDLTQQLNDERRKALNLTDEVNALKKDKDGLGKRVSDLEKQLADAKKPNGKKPNGKKPKAVPGECELMRQVLNDPYSYDLKVRENGWNAFLDLVFELAQALKWKDISKIDQKLVNVQEIRPVLEKLEELTNIPIVDKALETIKEEGWERYLQWLQTGGSLNGSVDGVIAKVNAVKGMETMPTVHSVKAVLDELNWLSYKAKYSLSEALKTNEDLQFLFVHVYPGKSLELYRELFGDPNTAIIRKRFIERTKCTPGGTDSVIQTLSNYKKNVMHDVSDINAVPLPGKIPERHPDDIPPPPKPFGFSYYGNELDSTDIEPALSYFEDTYEKREWDVNWPNFKKKKGRLCIWFWKYPYYKNVEGWKWRQGQNHKVVWFYKNWSSVNGELHQQYYSYMEAVYFPDDLTGVFGQLWKRRDHIVIPEDMLRDISLSRRKIKIRFSQLQSHTYDVVKYSENLDWEAGKVEFPEEHLSDLVKFIFLLHYMYIGPYKAGVVDDYTVYGWDGGGLTRYFLEKGRWEHSNHDDRIAYINDKISRITDKVIDLDLGWLFNVSPTGDRDLPNGHAYPYLYLYRYLRRVLVDKSSNHPWNLGSAHIITMFKKLDTIRRS